MTVPYTLDDFKNLICYRLSPGDTDLPSIPFFDMAITFYMLIGKGRVEKDLSPTNPPDGCSEEDADCTAEDVKDSANSADAVNSVEDAINSVEGKVADTHSSENESATTLTELSGELFASGIFKLVNGCVISPITADSLAVLNCTVDDLLPLAKANTPILNPTTGSVVTSDGVFLTADVYASSGLLDGGVLKEAVEYLGDGYLIIALNDRLILLTNGLSVEQARNMLNHEGTLTKTVYEYKGGKITATP